MARYIIDNEIAEAEINQGLLLLVAMGLTQTFLKATTGSLLENKQSDKRGLNPTWQN